MKHSPVDELYFKLFGEHPTKAGTALERLATIAYAEVKSTKASVDQRLKGSYSDSTYQIDGLAETDNGQEMIEAKDYTIRNDKVGRDDLQKLSGALLDLESISKGIFASATDYTKPAKQYADSTPQMPNAKPIELFDVRPSTEFDEKGRVKKICVRINIVAPAFENGSYKPVFTKDGYDKLQIDGLLGQPIEMHLEKFYDKNGKECTSFLQLTENISKNLNLNTQDTNISGTWKLKHTFIPFPNNKMYELDRIDYSIPIVHDYEEFTIESDGTPCLFIRSSDGKVDKLLTDKELKKYKFGNNGSVTKL